MLSKALTAANARLLGALGSMLYPLLPALRIALLFPTDPCTERRWDGQLHCFVTYYVIQIVAHAFYYPMSFRSQSEIDWLEADFLRGRQIWQDCWVSKMWPYS